MSRKRRQQRRKVLPDHKFGEKIVTKFINSLMWSGKKKAQVRRYSTVLWI